MLFQANLLDRKAYTEKERIRPMPLTCRPTIVVCAVLNVYVCVRVQLRVRVVEGRQLQGNNISPVCRVSVRRQLKQTDVCPSSNSPVWNKSFVFTFHVSVAEIVDDILLFEVTL